MVQLAHVSSFGSNSSTQKSFEVASAELGRLLSRLQQSTLHSDPVRERRLRTSEYERARLRSNLDYARRALTSLEQDALSMKAPGRRTETQNDLNQKREALKMLFERLDDLQQVAIDDDDDDSSEGEDLLGDSIRTSDPDQHVVPEPPAPAQKADTSLPTQTEAVPAPTATATTAPPPSESTKATSPVPATEPTSYAPSTETSQSLRSRTSAPSPPPSYTTSRAALFASRRKAASPLTSAPETSGATATAILEQQRVEQEALTGSMLDLAQRLKASTKSIHTELEADKDIVGRAGEGLDKTERTMESATGRMGVLRKMTEGEGWYGRLMLWVKVGVMFVVVLLIMFVMPKLRF
ncbi:membrane fusion protein use1 domain-containing protein [Sarocladium implicatum]|nr:membrane fusion protein use1 domain-containing protein [Sarocladium implicatum]